jgi:hypothetical protein
MDNLEYQIAIPSYERIETLRNATLGMLERYKVPKDIITIFVANELQYLEYYKAFPEYKIVVAVPGIQPARAFYNKYYPEGTRILSLDDDIHEIQEKNDKRLKPYEGQIQHIVNLGFSACESTGSKLWGLYPVQNGFFMSDALVAGLRFVIGNFFGSYAGDPVFASEDRVGGSVVEDYETTLSSFLEYGSVIRIDKYCAKTKMFAKGGIDAHLKNEGLPQRMTVHNAGIAKLHNRYQDLCKIHQKAGEETNLRLSSITHNKITI